MSVFPAGEPERAAESQAVLIECLDLCSDFTTDNNVKTKVLILRRKKDGDWYIYPQFLAHENFKNVHKKAQKGCKIFKPTIHNVLSTGTTIVSIWLSLCLIRCVRFARYCSKMYSRHLFSYGGLLPLQGERFFI